MPTGANRKPQDQSGRPLGPRAQQTRQRLLEATQALLEKRSVRELRVVEGLAKRIEEFQEAGRVAEAIHPWAAASSLLAMLERMSSYHETFEKAGVTRQALVEACARMLHATVTGKLAG